MYKCKGKNEGLKIATDIALEIHLIRIICLMSLVQPRFDADKTEAGVDAKAAKCTSMSGLFTTIANVSSLYDVRLDMNSFHFYCSENQFRTNR